MEEAVKELLFKMADDLLVIGHRNSEWTGLGPVLEEDIAFSSIAQDQLGQSLAIYNILHETGEPHPDKLAFARTAEEFKCCQLVEYPIGEYSFSLVRNFFFNHAQHIRFDMLSNSSFEPIAKLARKFRGEVKYHLMHADMWITQLGAASQETIDRLQSSVNETFNLALGIFEPGDFEEELTGEKIFGGEKILQQQWLEEIAKVIVMTSLKLPEQSSPVYGGRRGKHTEYLQPLLEEMTEVFKIEPAAEW